MANNERRRGDQDYVHRPTGIVIPLDELKPLTSEDEPNNELVIATSARNPNDIIGIGDGSNNVNINYTAKKNFSQGMMDIALLTANASQLRYVMRSPLWDFYHKMNITLISISIALQRTIITTLLIPELQIIAGILLVCVSRKDYKRKDVREGTRIMNDVVVILIFAITFVNIFIATFGIDDERTTFLRWKQTTSDLPSEPHFSTGV